jgi:hypothetical protein
MFEAKQGVPVTSTSSAWIMLNNLQYITFCIALKLTTYNFTVEKYGYTNVHISAEGLFLSAELLLHTDRR